MGEDFWRGGGSEADGGLGEDVEVAADEGSVEGSTCIECAEDGLVFGVDIDHLGVTEIGIVEGEDADYVAVGVVFGLHRNDSLEL